MIDEFKEIRYRSAEENIRKNLKMEIIKLVIMLWNERRIT